MKRSLTCLFVFSFLARLIFFHLFLEPNPIRLAYDSGHYHTVAQQMAEGKGFTNINGDPYFYRLPGYPAFLAVCYKIFGLSSYVALVVQMLLASVIPIFVFMLAWLLFRQKIIAWVSAIVTALHPGFLIMSGLIMSETLFVFLFLLFVICLVKIITQGRPGVFAFLAGFTLGLASLVRPVGLPVLLFSFVVLCITLRKRSFIPCVVMTLGWGVVVAPWLVRNFLLTGGLFLQTFSAPHLLNHGATRVVMYAHNISYATAREIVRQDVVHELVNHAHKHDEHAYLDAGETVARTIFLAHPFQTIKLFCINMFKTCFSLYSSELLVIDSGGQLPEYDAQRGVASSFKRFFCPVLNNRLIMWVIYLEMLVNFFIVLGVAGACWSLINGSRVFPRRTREPQDDKNIDATLSSQAGTWDPFQLIIPLGYAFLFIALSCVCGFARLRLPSEPFFIMLAVQYFYYLLHQKGE